MIKKEDQQLRFIAAVLFYQEKNLIGNLAVPT